ncbi:MAG: hypothetical protein ACXVCR_11500 [Bdellovibrio sp.]
MKTTKSILFKLSFVTSVLLSTSNLCQAGGRDSGGGTAVKCVAVQGDNHFPKSGWYFFDYAAGKQDRSQTWFVKDNDPKAHLHNVIARLFESAPYLFKYHIEFQNFEKNTIQDWVPVDMDKRLKNSDLPNTSLLPKNCDQRSVRQVVTYKNDRYFYDKQLMSELAMTGPAQISALYVHELFRQVSNYESGKTTEIANWNKILHNEENLNMSKNSFIELVSNHALSFVERSVNNIFLNHFNYDNADSLSPKGSQLVGELIQNLMAPSKEQIKNRYDISQITEGNKCENLAGIVQTSEIAYQNVLIAEDILLTTKSSADDESSHELQTKYRSSCRDLVNALDLLEISTKECRFDKQIKEIVHNMAWRCSP